MAAENLPALPSQDFLNILKYIKTESIYFKL